MNNHKVLIMDEQKRMSLFSAAMGEFAKNGYKKTTTDEIISKAGISKGLLFHYFGTKKELYIYLFEYASNILMNDYYNKIDYSSKDIFVRLKATILLKIEILSKHSGVFDFVTSAYFETDSVVVNEISADLKKIYEIASDKFLEDIDLSLFKTEINVQKAIEVIMFTFRGYSEAQASKDKKLSDYSNEYSRYVKEIDEYIDLLKIAFYRGN